MDIRQALLDDQGSKILELAADIAQYKLNPMDRMMLLQPNPEKAEYIALEGNRRTAALQILNNSDLLKDLILPDSLRQKFVELADNFDPKSVEPISGVLMPDRESARRWIELRHTGQNNGRGIVDWNGVQTARFRGDKMLDVIEFVKVKGELTPEEMAAIDTNFPITTLDRIISNPKVRQKIGLQIMDGKFFFSFPWKEEIKILKKIILDLATKKINVTAVKSKDQQISYIDSLPASLMPSGQKLSSPQSLASIMVSKPAPPPTPPTQPVSPLNRKTFFPKGFALSIPNQKAAQVFYELKNLNIEKFPVAGAISLRAFVEAIVEIYCDKHVIVTRHINGKNAGKSFSLAEKVEVVMQHVGNGLNKQEAAAARTALTSKDSVISIGRLNEYVHNPAVFPSKNDLIASWSGIEPFFRIVVK